MSLPSMTLAVSCKPLTSSSMNLPSASSMLMLSLLVLMASLLMESSSKPSPTVTPSISPGRILVLTWSLKVPEFLLIERMLASISKLELRKSSSLPPKRVIFLPGQVDQPYLCSMSVDSGRRVVTTRCLAARELDIEVAISKISAMSHGLAHPLNV